MLPLGSRGSKKCSECGITAHTRCEHYVPDFCGLSMEMANQMLAEIKAAAKRKTLESKTSSNRISKQDKVEAAQEAPLPAVPQPSADDELSSQLSSSMTLAPEAPSKSPLLVPQTPPIMYNNNANPMNQQPQPHPSQKQQPQQPYYSPQPVHMNMPQPPRIYPQQQSPQMQQQQRPSPPVLPAHGQQPPYGYNSGGAPVNVDPRYQQQQMYYQQQHQMQQQQQQQNRPPMSYNSYQQPQPQHPQHPQQMMGRPQPNPNYAPIYQQQQQKFTGAVPPNALQKQPSMMQQHKRKVALDNFSFLAVLGRGNFGKVMLAEEKFDKKLYAIKMLKKRFIIDNDEIER